MSICIVLAYLRFGLWHTLNNGHSAGDRKGARGTLTALFFLLSKCSYARVERLPQFYPRSHEIVLLVKVQHTTLERHVSLYLSVCFEDMIFGTAV